MFGSGWHFQLDWVQFSNPIELKPKSKLKPKSEQLKPKPDMPTPTKWHPRSYSIE